MSAAFRVAVPGANEARYPKEAALQRANLDKPTGSKDKTSGLANAVRRCLNKARNGDGSIFKRDTANQGASCSTAPQCSASASIACATGCRIRMLQPPSSTTSSTVVGPRLARLHAMPRPSASEIPAQSVASSGSPSTSQRSSCTPASDADRETTASDIGMVSERQLSPTKMRVGSDVSPAIDARSSGTIMRLRALPVAAVRNSKNLSCQVGGHAHHHCTAPPRQVLDGVSKQRYHTAITANLASRCQQRKKSWQPLNRQTTRT